MIQLHFKISFAGQYKFFPLIPLLQFIALVNGIFFVLFFTFSVLLPITSLIYKNYESLVENRQTNQELKYKLHFKINRDKFALCTRCGRKRLLNDKYCQGCGQTLQSFEEIEKTFN